MIKSKHKIGINISNSRKIMINLVKVHLVIICSQKFSSKIYLIFATKIIKVDIAEMQDKS
jgi:hypothetical protein